MPPALRLPSRLAPIVALATLAAAASAQTPTLVVQESSVDHPTVAVAYSPDGALLATANGPGRILLRHVASGLQVATLGQYTHTDTLCGYSALAFSPNGRYLYAGGDGVSGCDVVVQWNVQTGASELVWEVDYADREDPGS